MARFFTLSSSSKGNCAFVHGAETSLLVDAGISCKQIKQRLKEKGRDISEIDGVLITHEHSDHIKGLNVLLKQHQIPVYSREKTLDYLVNRNLVPSGANLIPINGNFDIKNINITAFDTPHDAVDSVGYRLEISDGTTVGVATDLGLVTNTVQAHLEGCNLVLIESNYDKGMLQCSDYPYMLKLRIGGEKGHLENNDCAQEISRLITKGSTRFILGHLSEENNMPRLAYETIHCLLTMQNMIVGKDYILDVAPARETGNMVVV